MATKTISLSEDAYERLKELKQEGESFSDTVRRITSRVTVSDFHGALRQETADDLRDAVRDHRDRHGKDRRQRKEELYGDSE